METGYWGIPGRTGGKIHLAEFGKPACGVRLSPAATYQWCAGFAKYDWLECEKCKRIMRSRRETD